MQTETNAIAPIAPATAIAPVAAIVPASETPTVAAPTVAPKAKRQPKAATPKPIAAPVIPASESFADARRAAAFAVGAFYTSGPSFPFKPASANLSDINTTNAKNPSVRTAALVAAMLAYAGDNIKADGTFVRGGFRVPARLINPNAKPSDTFAAMPESGCVGNMLGRVLHYVSGPIGGKNARDGIFRIDFAAARAELQQLGDSVAKPALAVLNKLAPVKPVSLAKAPKPAKAA